MHVDRVAYHLIGGNAFTFVAGVGQTGVGEVKRCVNLLGGHGGIHGVDTYPCVAVALPEGLAVHRIALLFDMLEVLGLGTLVGEAAVKAVEHYV